MRLLSLVVLASLSASTTRGALAQEGQPPRSTSSGAEGRIVERTYTADEGTRRYLVYVPKAHDGARALPLVVMLHGCTQDARDFAAGTRMNELAGENGVIVAWPEQPPSAHPMKCWNWYDPAHQGRAGEPALIAGITREVIREYRADTSRVYLAGISAGGAMALLVAVNYPDLWAAVGTHSGVQFRAATSVAAAMGVLQQGGPDPEMQGAVAREVMGAGARAIPLIIFHGAADATVRPVNAEQTFAQWRRTQGGTDGVSANETGTANGYGFTRTIVRDDGRVLLERWIVNELGHKWSGGSPDGTYTDPQGPDASRQMLRFFLAHSR